eukprot:3281405-Amphidinium_carterae.1
MQGLIVVRHGVRPSSVTFSIIVKVPIAACGFPCFAVLSRLLRRTLYKYHYKTSISTASCHMNHVMLCVASFFLVFFIASLRTCVVFPTMASAVTKQTRSCEVQQQIEHLLQWANVKLFKLRLV